MKKLILLLLFIPLVGFGQEDVELNLSVKDSTKNYFGIGFKFESSNYHLYKLSKPSYDALEGYKNILVLDLNYMINNFYVGAEYGTNISRNETDVKYTYTYDRNLHKFGLRLGYKTLNDKLIFSSTNGITYETYKNYGRANNNVLLDNFDDRSYYTKLSVIFNLNKRLVPELGIYHLIGSSSVNTENSLGVSFGIVYFFKPKSSLKPKFSLIPKSSKNKKLKNNEDVYTELKKLNELLELGIITQEEYVKKAEELKKVILD